MQNLNLSRLLTEDDPASNIEEISGKDIAIIGISGQLPMADNIRKIWDLLESGQDCVRPFPKPRSADTDRYLRYLNSAPSTFNYITGGYLENIDQFDYEFFRLSPTEARLMDPNQRLFLQTAWNALEDAGYGGAKIAGTKTGVYFGYNADSPYDYLRLILDVEPGAISLAVPGNISSIIAGRIAYLLDLKGPSMVIDTACSSALVALHLACQGIRSDDCEMALVGSCRLNLLPVVREQKLGIESSDGITHTFDESSDGTGLGEGVMAILLKPLSKALIDRDSIYAVIKGSAINQDGSSIGITAPNVVAQEEVITKTWRAAGVDPETITYIEAHGTGTKLGDPIEIDGITRAFGKYTTKKQFCAIGSIKTNLGHLDNAAGLAGLIKAILALKYQKIPPTLHFNQPNRKIDFTASPVYVNDHLRKWETGGIPRRCGVSAFGLSGTNCHVILEEAPAPAGNTSTTRPAHIFTLSAKKLENLRQLVIRYLEFLQTPEKINLTDLCYTAGTGRGHYNHRLAMIVSSVKDLQAKLTCLDLSDQAQVMGPDLYYREYSTQIKNQTDDELCKMKSVVQQKIKMYLTNPNQDGLLREICELYVQGVEVNWEELYRNETRTKINLPGYPFTKCRCWVEAPEVSSVLTVNSVAVENIRLPVREPSIFQELTETLSGFLETEITVNGDLMVDLAGFEEYGLLLLLQSFQQMKVFLRAGESYHYEELKKQIGVIPKLNRLFDALIDILTRGNFLVSEGERITVAKIVGRPETARKLATLDQMKEKFLQDYPDLYPYLRLLEACVQKYPLILPGKVPATSVVFPNASTELVEDIYRDNKNGSFCNELAAWCINKAIELRIPALSTLGKIRILEVGAGTGGTSTWVLEAIQSQGTYLEYYFTDISPSLVEQGQTVYGPKYPFVVFQKYDLEKEPKGPGFEWGSFDIILAANVVHATQNIVRSLKRLKRLLKTNGLFLLIEGTKPQDFGTLTFGILDGWWLYDDQEIRMSHSPLLDWRLGAKHFKITVFPNCSLWKMKSVFKVY